MNMVHSGLKASTPTEQDDAMTSHTPGPWKACGTIYKHMNAEIRCGAKGEGQGLAQVWDGPNAFKDALLMAAAPELLASVWALVEHFERVDGDERHKAVIAQACTAIGKATGTASAPALGTERSGVNQA